MKRRSDIVRLLDARSNADVELRQAVAELQAEQRSFGERKLPELSMRLQAALQIDLSPVKQVEPGPAARVPWRLVCLGALGTALVAAVVFHHRSARPEQPVHAENPASVAADTPAPVDGPQERPTAAPAPSPAPAANTSLPGAPHRPRAERPQPANPEHELSLLREAQSVLEREPQRSLRLVAQHAREYPRGVFAQEREVLAVAALLRLNRRALASARAKRFLHAYPGTPHARAVDLMLEGARGGPSTRALPNAVPRDAPGAPGR